MNHSTIDPRTLRITDMRFVDIDGAPKRCTILKLMTNQGLVGYGEVRDAASKTYALMLKSRLLGENPCDVDRIFHKIKQFGGPSRQAGGVCGVEIWRAKRMTCRSTSFLAVNSVIKFVFTATQTLMVSIRDTIWGWP